MEKLARRPADPGRNRPIYTAASRFLLFILFCILTVNKNNQKKITLDQACAGRRHEGERMKKKNYEKSYERNNEEPVLTP